MANSFLFAFEVFRLGRAPLALLSIWQCSFFVKTLTLTLTPATSRLNPTAVPSLVTLASSCSYDCTIQGQSIDLLWYPTVLTRIAATEIITISTFSGHQTTATSLVPAVTTEEITDSGIASFTSSVLQNIGLISIVNQTAIEVFNSQTAFWPTSYAYAGGITVSQTLLATENGTVNCKTSIAFPALTLIFPGGEIPTTYFSSVGVLTPSECTTSFDGVPYANIPVLSLTDTSTIYAPGAAPVSETQNPLEGEISSPSPISSPPPPPPTPPPPPSPRPSVPSRAEPTKTLPRSSTFATIAGNRPQQPPQVAPLPAAPGTSPLGEGSSPEDIGDKNGDTKLPAIVTPAPSSPRAAVPLPGGKPKASPPPIQVPVNLGTKINVNSEGAYVIGSQTLSPGSAIEFSGTPVSLVPGGSALVVGGTTVPFELPARPLPVTKGPSASLIGGVAAGDPQSGLVIGTQTAYPTGPAITVSGTRYSLNPSALIVGTSTYPLPSGNPSALFTAGGLVATTNSMSEIVIGGQTLVPGAPGIDIGGTEISFAPSGTAVVIGTSTIPLVPEPSAAGFTIDGLAFTDGPGLEIVIGSKTLEPGSPAITISGTPISLSPSGIALIISGSTFPLPSTAPPLIAELNGETYTESPLSDFVIGSQTLVPGGSPITINGTIVSLGREATDLVIGTQTEGLTTTEGLGGAIMSEFFGGNSVATGTSTSANDDDVVPFTSGSHSEQERFAKLAWAALAVIAASNYLYH